MIKRSIILLISLICTLAAHAQEFDSHWVSAPLDDSLAYVQFRRTFLSFAQPQDAFVTVTATGCFRLYVNQCNIGTAAFYPPSRLTFDVTDYLRPDTNVVALLCAPVASSSKQVSVTLYGHGHDGHPFAFVSDTTWRCRPAEATLAITVPSSSALPSLSERIDGRRHDPDWNAATIDTSSWRPVASPSSPVAASNSSSLASPPLGVVPCPAIYGGSPVSLLATQPTNRFQGRFPAPRTVAVLSPDSVRQHGDTLTAFFPQPFTGRVRLTIREARRGERISFGPHVYICNGRLDEQAAPFFVVTRQRIVTITGDRAFRPSHVVNIEGLITER